MECDLRRCSVADVGVDWSWEGVESCVGAMDSSSLCGYSKSLLEWLNRLGGFMWLLSLLHPLVQPEVEWLFDFDSFSTCTPLLGGHVNSCEKQRVQHHQQHNPLRFQRLVHMETE